MSRLGAQVYLHSVLETVSKYPIPPTGLHEKAEWRGLGLGFRMTELLLEDCELPDGLESPTLYLKARKT